MFLKKIGSTIRNFEATRLVFALIANNQYFNNALKYNYDKLISLG